MTAILAATYPGIESCFEDSAECTYWFNHIWNYLYWAIPYWWLCLMLASSIITVLSIFWIIQIIKTLGNTYDANKLILHGLLVVLQTTSCIVYVFVKSNASALSVFVILMDLVC